MFGSQLSRQHLIEKWLFWLHSRSSDNNPQLFIWIVWKIDLCPSFVFPPPWKPKKNLSPPRSGRGFLIDSLMCCLRSYPWFFIDLLIRMTLWLPTSPQAELFGPPIWGRKQERDKYLVRFSVKLRAALPLFSSIQTELPRKYPHPPTELNLPSST